MPLSKEQIAEMQAKAAARKGNFSSGDIPKFYPKKKDVLTGRFVPDSDLEIVRAVCEHKNATNKATKKLPPIPCVEGCNVCEKVNSRRNSTDGYQWTASTKTLAYFYVTKYSGENRHVKEYSQVLIIGSRDLGRAIMEVLENCRSDEEVAAFLDPTVNGPLCRLKFSDYGRVEITLEKTTMKVLPLPDHYPALSQAYIREGQQADPAVVKQFLTAFKEWARRSDKVLPDDEDDASPITTDDSPLPDDYEEADDDHAPQMQDETTLEQMSSHINLPVAPDYVPGPPENCPTQFGKKPQTYLPCCLTCEVADECTEATKGAA